GQPAGRCPDRAQADPQGAAACLFRLRSLGTARKIRRVQSPIHRFPRRRVMSEIRSLGYLRIEATDLGAWRDFGTAILGMTQGRGPEPAALYLRMDDFPARFVITGGETDRLVASGWEVASQADLAALGARLEVAGVPVKAGTPDELAQRRVAGMITFDDPSGHTLEVFWGAALDNRPAFCPYGVRFVTGEYGMGHVVIPAADDDASMEFYAGLLGFRLRDTMAMAPELF